MPIRPIIFGLELRDEPRMTICFPGRPNRFITVPIRSPGITRTETERAAVAQLLSYSAYELEVLRTSAAADPAPTDYP